MTLVNMHIFLLEVGVRFILVEKGQPISHKHHMYLKEAQVIRRLLYNSYD